MLTPVQVEEEKLQNYEQAKKFEVSYRKILRQMKKDGIKLEDAPKEVQEAALALHQNAIAVCGHEREVRKRRKHESLSVENQ
jgi:hypothetical protein